MALDQDKLFDELLQDYNPDNFFGKQGLLQNLISRFIERALESEMSIHLGYQKNSPPEDASPDNIRNGHSPKTIQSPKIGKTTISVPRDRNASFEPQLVKKHQRSLNDLDDVILSLYARGLSTRQIEAHLKEVYGNQVSPAFVSQITDAILPELHAWQTRPLQSLYPILYLDALMVNVRDGGIITKRALYLAFAINLDGKKELLGMWLGHHEGAKFWLSILTELKNRGVEDLLIACVDNLSGFVEAIEAVFPYCKVQLCCVHLMRNSAKYVNYKHRKELMSDLKKIYQAKTLKEAEIHLNEAEKKWGSKYPSIFQMWRNNWRNIITLFDYPKEIRRVIYTTNAVESLNSCLRRVEKTKGVFPDEDAVYKLMYLALKNISKKWTMPIPDWGGALNRFAVEFGERVSKHLY
ncbi:MAG: IS256 family transposase [Planctomycetota bacterium]